MTHRELIRDDNLNVFQNGDIEAGSVDLIYLDPPFNSDSHYNLPFKKLGKDVESVDAFKDTWSWDEETNEIYNQLQKGRMKKEGIAIKNYIDNVSSLRGSREDMAAYLTNMAIRLLEMQKVLKPTGSIYLHCDPTASHYLKVMMDSIFGPKNFKNEIIWYYDGPQRSSNKDFSTKHDVILRYSKTEKYFADSGNLKSHQIVGKDELKENYTEHESGNWYYDLPRGDYTDKSIERLDSEGRIRWTKNGNPRVLYFLEKDGDGNFLRKKHRHDVWTDIVSLGHAGGKEKVGYPTQKPLALLNRIIQVSSREGDLVLDPFCGCGTTVHAAENLQRQWIGIDISRFAIGVMKNRLKNSFSDDYALIEKVKFSGLPTTPKEAESLAKTDPWEFEKWVCGHIGAAGLYKNPGEKGGDGGIDGVIEFYPERQKAYAIVQVKGGSVKPNDVRALFADVDREPKAVAGVFVCFEKYRRTFENNRSHNTFTDKLTRRKWPIIQLLTIEDMLKGKEVNLPYVVEKKTYAITRKRQKDLL